MVSVDCKEGITLNTFGSFYIPQVLLLEAYEQLELDCAKEIDKALVKEREERGNLDRKVQFLQVTDLI